MSERQGTQVGFVGLGNMGRYMAVNLANALAEQGSPSPLLVWNRTEAKAEQVVQEAKSAKVATSVREIASSCDVIISSLASDEVVKSLYDEMIRIEKPKLFIETSTIFPTVTEEIERLAVQAGHQFVAALPFGQPPVAKSAQLVFAIGGETKAVERATKILVPAVGKQTMEFGSEARKASTFKLIGNSIILSTVEMMSESMTLAEKTGIGADRLLEWVHLFYPAPSAINYGTKVAHGKFEASGGFDLHGGLKDAMHISNLGKQVGVPMHIVDKAASHIEQTIELNKGLENKDWAALVAAQRKESGLEPFP